jgi:hypothetical protein
MDSTIKAVRVLLPRRSLRTLYQRGFNIIGYSSEAMEREAWSEERPTCFVFRVA